MSIKTFSALSLSKRILIVALALLTVLSPTLLAINNEAAHASSNFTEYPVPFGLGAEAITEGPDGALWFVEELSDDESGRINGTDEIVRVTPSGSFTEFSIPTYISYSQYAAEVGSITTGSDGALWFTEQNTSQIVRLTTTGNFTAYTIPSTTPVNDVRSLTSGSDGALWFTMNRSNKVGRITTSGSVATYSLPTSNADLAEITTGSDGALWFAERDSGKVGRITTSGNITEYALPSSIDSPNAITSGADGALWFTDSANNKIGRITTSGNITEYPVPSLGANPGNITVGPDDALWFTEDNNRIGRITMTGNITEYSLPSTSFNSSAPHDISAGPNGALWVTQRNANQVVRVNLPLALSAASPTQNPVLSWIATPGATSYNIYRNGTKIDSTTSTTYTDNNAPEGTHGYHITSVENTVESGPSNSISVVVDRTIPTLGALTWMGDNPVSAGSNTSFRIQASDTSAGILDGEYFMGTDPGIGNGTPLTWIGAFDSPDFGANLAPGVYGIGIRAQDAAGNWSTLSATHLVVSGAGE